MSTTTTGEKAVTLLTVDCTEAWNEAPLSWDVIAVWKFEGDVAEGTLETYVDKDTMIVNEATQV